MPDKEGADDEKKSTKSVVNKKQKQMMGEEGYDIARDMGRVRPSKDKKDATSYPPSDEVKKTQKVNKGPSALERVKAKYGKSVMDVGKKKVKEELDLTQVAEALGGYIVEAPLTSLTGDPEEIASRIKKSAAKVTRERQKKAEKNLAKDAGIKLTTQSPEQAAATQAAKDIGQDEMTSDVRRGLQSVAAGKGKSEPSKPRGRRAKRAVYKDGLTKDQRVAQVKSDIDQKELLKKAGASGDIGFTAPDRKEKVKKRMDRAVAQATPDPFDTPTADPKKMFPFGKKPVTGGLPMGEPTLPNKNQKTFQQFDRDRSDLKQAIRNLRTSKERMGQVSPAQKRKKEKQKQQSAFNRQQRQFQTDYMGGDFGMGQPEGQSSQVSRQKVTDFKTGKETEKMAPEKGGSVVVYRQRKGEDLVKDLRKKKDPVIKPEIVKGGGDITSGLRTVNATRLQNIKATGKIALQRYSDFAKNNPALGLATYDMGKGLIGKIMKIRLGVQGGRAGTRSAAR